MSELSDRIRQVLEYSKKNVSQFASTINARTPQAIRELLKGRTRTLSPDMQERILGAYPEINKVWLLTGEGEMLREKDSEAEIGGEGYWVPLLPVSAIGGSLSGFDTEGIDPRRCDRFLSPIPDVDLAIPIFGDSMEPEYPNGSHVLVRKVRSRNFISWGNVYVLDTIDGPILKVVQKSDNPDSVTCVSLNPSGRYQPFDVPKSDIRGMYRVLLCISIKGQ